MAFEILDFRKVIIFVFILFLFLGLGVRLVKVWQGWLGLGTGLEMSEPKIRTPRTRISVYVKVGEKII
jgi:hypothetical protein